MKYLIVEDEINACEYIRDLVTKLRPDGNLLGHIDSVEETINWLNDSNNKPDLIFMDIQLSDGINQFAIQAFKVNGLDYLLKPIAPEDLESSLIKFEEHRQTTQVSDFNQLKNLVSSINREKKNRFLIKKGSHFEFIDVAAFTVL